jgi:hypothetical protein
LAPGAVSLFSNIADGPRQQVAKCGARVLTGIKSPSPQGFVPRSLNLFTPIEDDTWMGNGACSGACQFNHLSDFGGMLTYYLMRPSKIVVA